jgi:hypothetical protein
MGEIRKSLVRMLLVALAVILGLLLLMSRLSPLTPDQKADQIQNILVTPTPG